MRRVAAQCNKYIEEAPRCQPSHETLARHPRAIAEWLPHALLFLPPSRTASRAVTLLFCGPPQQDAQSRTDHYRRLDDTDPTDSLPLEVFESIAGSCRVLPENRQHQREEACSDQSQAADQPFPRQEPDSAITVLARHAFHALGVEASGMVAAFVQRLEQKLRLRRWQPDAEPSVVRVLDHNAQVPGLTSFLSRHLVRYSSESQKGDVVVRNRRR
jgi:hypothetical protein